MGPIWINIIKALKLIVQLGPIIYEGIKWGKKIYKEVKKKPTNANQIVLMAESGKRGIKYSREVIKKKLSNITS